MEVRIVCVIFIHVLSGVNLSHLLRVSFVFVALFYLVVLTVLMFSTASYVTTFVCCRCFEYTDIYTKGTSQTRKGTSQLGRRVTALLANTNIKYESPPSSPG